MESKFVPLYTHGFIFGFLTGIDNDYLANTCIKNYHKRVSDKSHISQSEDIIIPRDKNIIKIATELGLAYKKHFNKTLNVLQEHWSQVHYKNESTQFHDHLGPDTVMVGVYYVKAPPNSGDLVLRYKKHEFDRSEWIFPPQENKFIMFEPGMVHGVTPNKSEEPRICISINFKIDNKRSNKYNSWGINI
jgi:uncharacterized protein (TIGR02466 family)